MSQQCRHLKQSARTDWLTVECSSTNRPRLTTSYKHQSGWTLPDAEWRRKCKIPLLWWTSAIIAQKNPPFRRVNTSDIFLPNASSNQTDNTWVGKWVRLNMSIVRKMSMPKLETFNEMLEWDSCSENLVILKESKYPASQNWQNILHCMVRCILGCVF